MRSLRAMIGGSMARSTAVYVSTFPTNTCNVRDTRVYVVDTQNDGVNGIHVQMASRMPPSSNLQNDHIRHIRRIRDMPMHN